MSLNEQIKVFLEQKASENSNYWRAVEIHEKIVGAGEERILDIKSVLEEGVDEGIYERIIKKKGKEHLVGYRLKRREEQVITKGDVGKASDILGTGWERKKG